MTERIRIQTLLALHRLFTVPCAQDRRSLREDISTEGAKPDQVDVRAPVGFSFCSGLLEETHHAMSYEGLGDTACQAAGYAEAIAFHHKHISLNEAIERTKKRTRQLAKRQLTWLRSFKHAIWITA